MTWKRRILIFFFIFIYSLSINLAVNLFLIFKRYITFSFFFVLYPRDQILISVEKQILIAFPLTPKVEICSYFLIIDQSNHKQLITKEVTIPNYRIVWAKFGHHHKHLNCILFILERNQPFAKNLIVETQNSSVSFTALHFGKIDIECKLRIETK